MLSALEQCRTAALGGHVYECDHCGHRHPTYNSCRNRHCPKCQGLDREEWLQARRLDLLPVPYFHLVFTIPDSLHELVRANPRALYSLLFSAAQESLLELGWDRRYLGAEIGILAVLHTWTQTLTFHPHLHCIVPGGGLAANGRRWIPSRKRNFLLPVRVVSRLFRGKVLAGLRRLAQRGAMRWPAASQEKANPLAWKAVLARHYHQEWNVYCQPPFAGPDRVLTYLARYVYRIAISNSRLIALAGDDVVFQYRDRADQDRLKVMRLPVLEFLRRFLLHVLPDRFVRVRYFGLLAHRHRRQKLERCRLLLGAATPTPARQPETWQERLLRLTGFDVALCPHCGQGRLCIVEVLPSSSTPGSSRGPP